jgi:hypothetical protein
MNGLQDSDNALFRIHNYSLPRYKHRHDIGRSASPVLLENGNCWAR